VLIIKFEIADGIIYATPFRNVNLNCTMYIIKIFTQLFSL